MSEIGSTEEEKKWIDMTEFIRSTANAMSYQMPMIAHESFSLYDSMSAVEIMDPKMDQFATVSKIQTFDQMMLVEIPSNFADVDLNEFMKSIVIHEVSFLLGASVLESTHFCLPIWEGTWSHIMSKHASNPHISSLVSYCKCLNKSLHHIHKAVVDADIYEEEDFQPIDYAYLANDLSDETILDLSSHLSVVKSSEITCISSQDNNESLMTHHLMHIRLVLYKIYKHINEYIHITIATLNEAKYSDENDKKPFNYEQQSLLFKGLMTLIEEGQCHLQAIITMISSHTICDYIWKDLSSPCSSSLSSDVSAAVTASSSISSIVMSLYSTDIVKLVQTNPIRAIQTKSFYDSIKELSKLLTDLHYVSVLGCQWIEQKEKNTLEYMSIFHYMMHMSMKNYHILTRSLLKLIIDSYHPHMSTLVIQSMINSGIPTSYYTHSIVQEKWLNVIGNLCYETLKTLSVHRCKLLVKLDNIFNCWGVISTEAPYVDQQCISHITTTTTNTTNNESADTESTGTPHDWFTCWVMNITTLLMDLSMQLNVDMNLLSISEMDYFYWYWDYICSSRSWILEKLRSMQYEDQKLALEKSIKELSSSNNSNISKKTKKQLNELQQLLSQLAPPLPSVDELYSNAKSQVCRGQLRMLLAFMSMKIIEKKGYIFTTWAKKFEKRFSAFQGIPNPSLLSYSTYENTLQLPNTSSSSTTTTTTQTVDGDTTTQNSTDTLAQFDPCLILDTASSYYMKSRQYIQVYKDTNNTNNNGAGINIHIDAVSVADQIAKENSISLFKAAVANSVNAVKCSKLVKDKGLHPTTSISSATTTTTPTITTSHDATTESPIRETIQYRVFLQNTHHSYYPIITLLDK